LFVRFLFKRTKAQVPIPRDSCYLHACACSYA
jgi:hypothetical protein